MDACALRQNQQRGRARWWRSRLRSETGRSEQGRSILCHSAIGRLTGARADNAGATGRPRSTDCHADRGLAGYSCLPLHRIPPEALIFPKALKPVRRQGRIALGAYDRAMTQIGLDRPGILAVIGELVAG